MKIQLFAVVVMLLLHTFLSQANASSPVVPTAGAFPFTGNISIEQMKVTEVVYAFTDEGQKRLEELRGEKGTICSYVERSIYRCDAFKTPSAQDEADVSARVLPKFTDLQIAFGELRGTPEPNVSGTPD